MHNSMVRDFDTVTVHREGGLSFLPEEAIRSCQTEITQNLHRIDETKTELQRFKLLAAIFESLPQFVLQWSIRMKQIYANEEIDWYDPLFWFLTLSSIASVFITFTGLTCEMPVVVHEKEMPPFRSLGYTYGKVLPLVVLCATPRLMTMIGLWSFVTFEDVIFYIPFVIVYFGLFVANCVILKCWLKKKYPVLKIDPSVSNLIDLGLVTSFVCPSVIGILDSGFLLITSLTSTVIHALALGSLCLFGMYLPDWVFHSDLLDVHAQEVLVDPYETSFWYLKWYTFMLVPTILLFSNAIAIGIQKVYDSMNTMYFPILASDINKLDCFKGSPSISNKMNDLMPMGDGRERYLKDDSLSYIQYVLKRSDEVSAKLIEHYNDKESPLSPIYWTWQRLGKDWILRQGTALMVACDKAYPKTVEVLFKKALEGFDILVNAFYLEHEELFGDKNDNEDKDEDEDEDEDEDDIGILDELGKSALHFAVLSNGPLESKKEIITLFWSYANQLNINLLITGDGPGPIDILENSTEGKAWLEELGNPRKDLDLLNKAIDENDFDTFKTLAAKTFAIVRTFAMHHAIEYNEDFAIRMIEQSQELDLKLNSIDEGRHTFLSRSTNNAKIAKAILGQAKFQDIAINNASRLLKNTGTAFVKACRDGSFEVVEAMLEQAEDLKIDLNAKDGMKRTGFMWACAEKHSKVVDLIVANAESLKIDLFHKQTDDKSGFDLFPEHFQNNSGEKSNAKD